MLDNVLADEGETSDSRNVLLQKNANNTTEEACKQGCYFKENENRHEIYAYNQKNSLGI